MTKQEGLGVGIDVSKATIDFALSDGSGQGRLPRTSAGLVRLADQLVGRSIHRVVVEATGGYELLVLHALFEAGLPVVRVAPLRARHFAKALGRYAKTDAIDAAMLARMACVAVESVPLWQPPSEGRADLRALYERRGALLKMRDAEKKRAARRPALVAESIRNVLSVLDSEIRDIERRLDSLLRSSPELGPKARALTSVSGVGPQTAAALLAYLPELGRASRREIAALAGVAPLARDSGTYSGRRFTYGGRSQLRRALYMSALVAARFNPEIRAFYESLVLRGKPKKLALVACMRKLLVHLNARLRFLEQSPGTATSASA